MFCLRYLRDMKTEINSFWLGDTLSLMEKLTIKSFIDNGHTFNLYTYSDKLKNSVPDGTIVLDANEIIPSCELFVYNGNGDCRSGSLGCGFTDLFRYKLLHERGGWYVDMDVTCLKNFSSITSEYVLRPHIKYDAVSNIIKLPKGSQFALDCYNDIKNRVNSNNDKWELVIEIFCDNIRKHNLSKYIVDRKFFGYENWKDIYRNFEFVTDNKEEYAIHWMNEVFKHRGVSITNTDYKVDYERPLDFSVYCDLLQKHNLIDDEMIRRNNKFIINGLWIGEDCSLMEKLTIKSFLDHFPTIFILWCYSPEKMKNHLSELIRSDDDELILSTLIIKDANQIIPKEKVFCYVGNGDCRKGSYGGFSDLFRYELLYKRGGWYVDMDVTCLNDFRVFDGEYVIRPHHKTEIVGNIIKVPKKSLWMNLCRKETWETIDKNNNDWHKPIEILRKHFHSCGLEKFVVDIRCFGNDGTDNYNIASEFYHRMFYPNKSDFNLKLVGEFSYKGNENMGYLFSFNCDARQSMFSHAIHWMNEANKNGIYKNKIDWNRPKPKSRYASYLKQFGLYRINK